MSDNKPGGLKLKLRKADTNRLKTETGRIKTVPTEDGAAEAQTRVVTPAPPVAPPPPAPVPRPDQTAEIRDPMALRDTSHGKLKRVQSPDETANAVAPVGTPSAEADDEPGVKRETVRLKVVRDKKHGGPQILPSPEGEAQPEIAPPGPAAITPPSAQTVKISIPGLKKAPSAASASSLKHATATVRIQEPSEEPGSTLKVTPPEESGEFHETSTATLKLAPRQPGAATTQTPGGPAGTIRITPGPALTAKGAEAPEQNKQVTATLKIRPGATAEPPPSPDTASNKQVTATLKIRSGAAEAPEAASTVRITPPAAAGAETTPSAQADEDAGANRPSLRLKRPDRGSEEAEVAATVRLPGLDEADEPAEVNEAGRTVALPTAEEPEAPAGEAAGEPGPAVKKGLKFKTAKKHGDEPVAEGEAAPEPEPTPGPRAAAGGPGLVAAIAGMAACAALGTLLCRLVMDYLAHLR